MDTLTSIAGALYPDLFYNSPLLEPMLATLHIPHTPKQIFSSSFKQCQLGSVGFPLTYNGKKNKKIAWCGNLYNSENLIYKLQHQGCSALLDNSANIALHAYEYLGIEFLKELKGSFAFALVDHEQELLLLVRDQIGRHPLFWFQSGRMILFASQIKALLATGVVPQELALDGLSAYLQFGYVPQDMTIVRHINKLLPGHYLLAHFDGRMIVKPYWSYSALSEHKLDLPFEQCVNQLDVLLRQAVKSRLDPLTNPSCLVSGGLGSASIAYYVSSCSPVKPAIYSTAFLGENEADLTATKIAADTLGCTLSASLISPEMFTKNLPAIVWALDEPLGDPNIIATWHLASLAAKNSLHVFSGMGCDELLAGHNRYTMQEQPKQLFSKAWQHLKRLSTLLLRPLMPIFSPSCNYALMKSSHKDFYHEAYLQKNVLMTHSELAMLAPDLPRFFDPEVFLQRFANYRHHSSLVETYCYFDLKTRLPDLFMLQFGRSMAAHGLIWHTPYLDIDVVEFTAKLPEPMTMQADETAAYLKAILNPIFPPSFIQRQKKSRPSFLQSWISSRAMDPLLDRLSRGILVETGILKGQWFKKHLASEIAKRKAFRALWALLILEIWVKLFLNRSTLVLSPQSLGVTELLLEKKEEERGNGKN